MTAYNRENYLAEAIESVLQSTYTNFELIIVDDCSSDSTVDIARSYAAKDERIKVYVNEFNLGDYNNRNKAAGYAVGKYIKYVDSDDFIYPHGLEVMVHAMETFPQAAVGILSIKHQEEKPFPFLVETADVYRRHFFGDGLLNIGPLGLIIVREKFLSVGGFSGARYIGDSEFMLKIGKKYPVVKFASSLVYWREHEEQERAYEHQTTIRLESTLPMLCDNLLSGDCFLTKKECDHIINYFKRTSARDLMHICLKGKPLLAYRVYKKLNLNPSDFFSAVFSRKPLQPYSL